MSQGTFNIDKAPTSLDYSNGGTIALPSSWVTQVNALIAAAGGLTGMTVGGILYAATSSTVGTSANATLDTNGSMLVKYLTLQSSAAGLNDIGGIFSSVAAQKWAIQLGASQELIIQDFVNNKNVIKLTPAATPTVTLLGNLVFNSDNAYDIGASGATRPKNLYVAGTGNFGNSITTSGSLIAAAGGGIVWSSRSGMYAPSDGIITLYNNATTDFTCLQFGGTTSSFPAIKRSTTEIHFRLADDSNYCTIFAYNLKLAGQIGVGVPWSFFSILGSGNTSSANTTNNSLLLGANTTLSFVSSLDAVPVNADANFSRISAGVIGVGTGAAASVAGTLQALKLITGSGSAAAQITLTGASISGQYLYINTSSQVANDVGIGITFGGATTGALLGHYYQATASLGFGNRLSNADNTNATANCYKRITVGGGSGGDAFTRYEVAGVTDWSVGIDNSNNDCLTIGPNADPSTGNAALTIHPTTYLLTLKDAMHISLGSGTGTKLGNATGEKLGFWGVTPVVQQVLATGAGATVDNVISLLQTLGLCKQS